MGDNRREVAVTDRGLESGLVSILRGVASLGVVVELLLVNWLIVGTFVVTINTTLVVMETLVVSLTSVGGSHWISVVSP